MQQRLSILAMSICSFVALIGISATLASSFWPTARANAAIPSVQMPLLRAAEFIFVDEPGSAEPWQSQLLFVRNPDGHLHVWRIPVRNGVHRLPDIHWWKHGQSCEQFRPDFAAGTIGCKDKSLGPWAQINYQWNLEGKNLRGQVDDLERVDGIEIAGDYLLTKPR